MFIGLLTIYSTRSFAKSLIPNSEGCIKCVSPNNRPCQARPIFVNIKSNKPLYYPFTVCVNKFDGNCNTTDDAYVRVYVSDPCFNVKGK